MLPSQLNLATACLPPVTPILLQPHMAGTSEGGLSSNAPPHTYTLPGPFFSTCNSPPGFGNCISDDGQAYSSVPPSTQAQQGYTISQGSASAACYLSTQARQRTCSPNSDVNTPPSFSAWNYTGPFSLACVESPGGGPGGGRGSLGGLVWGGVGCGLAWGCWGRGGSQRPGGMIGWEVGGVPELE